MRAWCLLLLAAASATVPDLACTTGDSALVVEYAIPYYKGSVDCGNLFVKADIATRPLVRFAGARADKTYTLLYFSTESHATLSWPDNVPVAEGDVHNHWVVANITAAVLLGDGNLTLGGDELWGDDWPRHGPSPSQPYSFYLMEHDGPTPAPNSSSVAVDCYPSVTQYCTHEEFDAWLGAFAWARVGNNYLTGIFYNDTFRAP